MELVELMELMEFMNGTPRTHGIHEWNSWEWNSWNSWNSYSWESWGESCGHSSSCYSTRSSRSSHRYRFKFGLERLITRVQGIFLCPPLAATGSLVRNSHPGCRRGRVARLRPLRGGVQSILGLKVTFHGPSSRRCRRQSPLSLVVVVQQWPPFRKWPSLDTIPNRVGRGKLLAVPWISSPSVPRSQPSPPSVASHISLYPGQNQAPKVESTGLGNVHQPVLRSDDHRESVFF